MLRSGLVQKTYCMKKLLLISITVFITMTLSAQDKKKLAEVTFETSITCDNCVNTIMGSLPLEKGIKDVKCNLDTREVKVTFRNDKTDTEKVKRSIEKLGFSAKEKKPEKKKVSSVEH